MYPRGRPRGQGRPQGLHICQVSTIVTLAQQWIWRSLIHFYQLKIQLYQLKIQL